MPLDFEKVDLGSFGINEPLEQDDSSHLRANLSEAFKVNPDDAAQNLKLSRESGVPTAAVASDRATVENNLKFKNIDFSQMSQRNPNTAKYLTDFNHATIAQDDLEVLQLLEAALTFTGDVGRSLPAGAIQGFGMAFEGAGRTIDVGARSVARGLDAILPESFDQYLWLTEQSSETEKLLAQLTPQSLLKYEGRGLKQAAVDIGAPEDRQNLATDISMGLGQLGSQLAATIVNPAAALGMMFSTGVDIQGERQEASGTEGRDLQSDLALLTGGAITAGTEKLGLDALLNRIPPKIKNDFMRQVVDVSIAGGIEAVQEVAEGIAQGLLEQYTTNPDAEIFEGLDREALAAGGAGAIFRALVNAITPGRVRSVQDDDAYRQSLAAIEQEKLDKIAAGADRSKLKQRDVESFRQFMQQADGDQDSQVFIDGAQAALYLNTKTRDEIAADPALQALQRGVREASVLGVDVTIPVADFAADVAGSETYDALRDHMTMSSDTVSPFRQEQVKAETGEYVTRLMAEAQENVSEYVESQQIYEQVQQQLVDTGAVNDRNAAVMAQVVPAWATAYARRNGISVAEAYQKAGLTIQGPQTGEIDRLTAEQILTQPQVQDVQKAEDLLTEIRDFSEVDAAGLVTVYHRTSEQSADDINDRRVMSGKEDGLFFSTKRDSRFEGDSVVELKVPADQLELDDIFDDEAHLRIPVKRGVDFDVSQFLTRPGVTGSEQQDGTGRAAADQQQTSEPSDYARAAGRTDAEAVAEFERAKAGETVTFTQRTAAVFDSFDDGTLGKNTTTPSASLGHFLSAADVGNPGRYGDQLKVVRMTLTNPIVVDADTFESVMADKTTEEAAVMRQQFIESGHDGILINGLNWAIVFQGANLEVVQDSTADLDVDSFFLQFAGRKSADDDGLPVARGYYDPVNSVIRLTEAADLSTFLHEFAHFMYEMEVGTGGDMIQSINNWYKRNAIDVAKEANTYVEGLTTPLTADDVVTYLETGNTGDQNKDKAIRRAVHEQFARGFETYLMEGKAPSIELRNAFRTFARWLVQIYRAVRGQLNVSLDDEMRQVFDRMLATEEQIATAEARARHEPLFTDAVMAGMTDEEFTAYQKRQQKVKDVQSETLRDKLIKQLTRQTEAWWKEEKADLVSQNIDRLSAEPVYRARARLRDGDIKLDHATVKEMVGVTATNKRGQEFTTIPTELRGMTAKGQAGVHPDEAAAFFGYDSGSELLNDLITAPKIQDVAETNAQAQMIEMHGDILSDGSIEKEADEAVQNEERGKLLLDELKVLSKGTNQPVMNRTVIKQLAEDRVGKLAFREIHPGKYRKAEIRAAQEAAAALVTGNREGAAAAKARQVLNYYLGMAATNAKNDTMKIVDRMARYNKKTVQQEIQKADGGYWEQIVKILERFEFRKSATLRQVDQRNQDINTWAKERMETDGDGLVLTPAVLNESYVTHWKNVPYSELQGINDSVKNIEHVVRYANKLTRMGEEIEFNKLVDRWTKSMDEVATDRFVNKRTDVVEGRNWGRWFMAQMTKIPYLASWLDGGERAGISHQVLVQPFTDAYDAEIRLWEQAGKPVMDAIANRSKADIKRHNRKIYIPEIDDNLFGNQVLAVALNTGNAGNLRKMLLGEGWADPDNETTVNFNNPKLQAVLRHMTKSDWELVQNIWDQMDTLYPQLAEVHRRTTGLTPPKVDATPVETPFGTFKGGYYPVKYDPNRSHQAQVNEDRLNAQVESMFSNNASIQASVNASATNERTGYYAPIRLSLDVVPAHFQETIHFITHHDAVREVNRLIRNRSVADTIKAKLGKEEYAQLKPWLNDIAKDGRETPTKMFWDSMLQRLRFGVTLGTMGFKASTGIIQISGLSNTVAEVGLGNTAQAMRGILGSTTTIKQAWEFAIENSKVLSHRAQTMDREIKNAMTRLEGKRGVLAAAQEASMKHIALIQTYMVDLPSWHAAYIKGMKDWGDEQRAFQYADWVIENVQGSGATKDMAQIMRGQSETGRMFTMFMTFFSSLWNLERDLVKGARSGAYSTSTVAAKVMFLFTIPVLFEMMMRGELGEPDDEDDRLQLMLTKVALYPVQSVPFIRDIATATTGEFGYNMTPLASVIEQGTRTIPNLVTKGFTDDEISKSDIKGATKFVGAAAGVPGVNQAWATGEHLYDVLTEGEEFTTRELLFGPNRN